MRVRIFTLLVAAAVGTMFLALTAGSYGLHIPIVLAEEDTVARGRALADTICIECHSPRVQGDPYQLDQTKLYAGGGEYPGPWGVVYARNTTPDRETGIGAWTDEEIKRAIRDGIGRDGTKLLIMPWEIFRGLADEDINAMVVYLRTVPPVRNKVSDDKIGPLPFPPQVVAGMIESIPPLRGTPPPTGTRDLFYLLSAYGPSSVPPALPGFKAPQGKDSVERGAYLAKNLLGCTVCHAPNLAGGTEPFFARNVTPDVETGIGLWTKEDIVKSLREGLRPTGLQRRDPSRPSREAVQPGLRRLSPAMPSGDLAYGRLSDDDVYNVVAYLQSVPPVRRAEGEPNPAFPPPPGPPAPPPGLPAELPRTGDSLGWVAGVLALLGILGLGAGFALRLRRT